MGRKCEGCEWWDVMLVDNALQAPTDNGLCRKGRAEYVSGFGRWPVVKRFDWCGEYQEIGGISDKARDIYERNRSIVDLDI